MWTLQYVHQCTYTYIINFLEVCHLYITKDKSRSQSWMWYVSLDEPSTYLYLQVFWKPHSRCLRWPLAVRGYMSTGILVQCTTGWMLFLIQSLTLSYVRGCTVCYSSLSHSLTHSPSPSPPCSIVCLLECVSYYSPTSSLFTLTHLGIFSLSSLPSHHPVYNRHT